MWQDMAAKRNAGTPESGRLGPLRTAAMLAVVAGAVGSVGLTLRAGHRNNSLVLQMLFLIWVLLPFVALALLRNSLGVLEWYELKPESIRFRS